ncbi:hypothetical protein GCM10023219_09780 [Stakelama sediminis]|uniref:Phasin family protein n=1 Tax=Stakelama sediminis TaxID=463200 RepID=A0A840YVW2_9SPHN|nr:phasin family protein [Stakelama sediminis]MBB5717700.1 phasin family protein [Stakelama sediminis]
MADKEKTTGTSSGSTPKAAPPRRVAKPKATRRSTAKAPASKPVAAKSAAVKAAPTPAKKAAPVKVQAKPAPATAAPAPAKAAPAPAAEVKEVKKPDPAPAPAAKVVETAPKEIEKTVEAAAAPAKTAIAQSATAVEKAVAETSRAAESVAASTIKEKSVMTTVEATMEKGQAMFAEMNEKTKAAFEKNAKMVEEFNDFAKGNVEAMVESGRIAAKGLESLGQDAAEYGRKSFESATAAMKSMSSVKSPTELLKLQGDFFRGAFDSYVAEASKQTEAMLKLAGDAAQPLSNRVAVAADKVKTVA